MTRIKHKRLITQFHVLVDQNENEHYYSTTLSIKDNLCHIVKTLQVFTKYKVGKNSGQKKKVGKNINLLGIISS